MKEKNMTILESKKELFEAPKADLIVFIAEDVIDASNGFGEGVDGEENEFI